MDLTRLERLAEMLGRLSVEERQADAAALRDALRWMREAREEIGGICVVDQGDTFHCSSCEVDDWWPARHTPDCTSQRLIREYEEGNRDLH